MSLFNKMLASIGIGNAKVDTRLASSSVRVGDKLEGIVHIQGGSAEQKIDTIYLHLMTSYLKQTGDSKVMAVTSVVKWRLPTPLEVGVEQKLEVPFSFELPLNTPVTTGKTPIWVKTGLDIDNAIDPGDNDRLEVLPHPHMQAVLDTVTSMGFAPKEAICEQSHRLGRGLPFVQEFEFHPPASFSSAIKELELVFFVEPQGVEVLVEVDRRARGFNGLLEAAFELDERKQKVRFTQEELARGREYLTGRLTQLIERHSSR